MNKALLGRATFKTVAYFICIALVALSLFPFIIMIINATRSTPEIQQNAISLIPSTNFATNMDVLTGRMFDPLRGIFNSLVISTSATLLTVYFSTLTAFALVAYNWRMRQPFFTLIMVVMMIPAQVSSIGFFQFMFRIGWTNNFLPLIIPAVAAPMAVFFLRQYMLGALSMELLEAARIDGSSEIRIFNQIVIPIMKPAMATQAIFAFVASWNNLFIPSILLTRSDMMTLPIMVSLLRGDAYRVELGAVYLGLALAVLPLLITYFIFSKYIVAGVALGGVKG
ncbi:MAG: carbohydrate ABC transporter permease [Oscillospiraceae bacterium]|nr:carbohydrate ABC transporter permease [Oscillospiraceae bacterium]